MKFGAYNIILDSRSATFDRISMESTIFGRRLHSDAGMYKHAIGLGAAVVQMESYPIDKLYVYVLDCDENKLVAALKQLPSTKLPNCIVAYGPYSNLVDRFQMALNLNFGGAIEIIAVPSEL